MTPIEGADWGVGAAILAMAVATYAMRAGGFWLMARVPLTPRLRRMLDALPGSVVVAAVLPLIVREGPVAVLAIAAAGRDDAGAAQRPARRGHRHGGSRRRPRDGLLINRRSPPRSCR